MKEKRESVRVPLVVKVSLHQTDEAHYYFSKDISKNGMFIETKEAFPVGSEVALDFSVPLHDEQQKFSVVGEIARTISFEEGQQQGRTPGMGIHFRSLPPEVHALLADFIEELLTLRGSA